MMTLPHGWPINDFCDDCKDASFARAVEAGRQRAREIEQRILDSLMVPSEMLQENDSNYASAKAHERAFKGKR